MPNTKRMNVGIGAMLGAIVLLAPYYLGATGLWRWPFFIVGGFLVLFTVVSAAAREQGGHLKDAVASLSVGLLLAAIAGAVALADARLDLSTPISVTLRIFVLVLALLAGTGLLQALDQYAESRGEEAPKRDARQGRRDFARTLEVVIVPLMGLATAVLVLVKELLPQ